MMGQINNKDYKKAINYAVNKNSKQALESINRAIDLEGGKTPSLFYFHKYEYLVKLHKYKLAFETLNDAIYIFPNSTLLLNARAEFYFAVRMYKKVILDYEKIISFVKGEELNAYNIKLASIKFLVRDFEGVAVILKSIFKKKSSSIDILNLLAALHIEFLSYEKAKKILHAAADKHPSHVFTIINLGFVYQKENQHKESLFYFDKALRLNPNNPIALSNRAYSKLKMSNIDGAISDINKSIELMQSNAYAYMIRGRIYLSLNKIENACVDFTIAKNLNFLEQYGTEVDKLISENCK